MDIHIIIPPVWPGIFTRTGELFLAAARSLGLKGEIAEVKLNPQATLNIIVGWGMYEPEIPENTRYVIYQQEPLHHEFWINKLRERESLFVGALSIWDYSQSNFPLLSQYPKNWFPMRYHPDMKRAIQPHPPQWDVLFTGYMTPRRHKLLQELSKLCCVSVQYRWGREFEDALKKAKVIINIHQNDEPTPIEQSRVSFALNNDCFILTEDSADEPYLNLPTAPYDKLIEAVMYYLNNSARREEDRLKACTEFKQRPSMTEVFAEALAGIDDKI